jgi:hypothetical protein
MHRKWLESEEYNRKVVHPDGQVTWREVKYKSMQQLEDLQSWVNSGDYYSMAAAHQIKNGLPRDRSGWEKIKDEWHSEMHITRLR